MAKAPSPRNKNGKTNEGIPYRYTKAVKSPALKSSAVDLTVLNKNEMTLLTLLKKNKSMSIADLQDAIFSEKSYKLYGTSDTRNLLRRVGTNATGAKLIERVPGERGVYRLSKKGVAKLAEFKKPKKKAPGKKKAAAKKSTAKKSTAKKSTAKKAPAKAKKPAAKKAPVPTKKAA